MQRAEIDRQSVARLPGQWSLAKESSIIYTLHLHINFVTIYFNREITKIICQDFTPQNIYI